MADQVPQAPVIPVADVFIPADAPPAAAPPAAAPPAVNAVPANADNLEIANLLQRIQALESQQQTSVENGLSGLAAYGLRRKPDLTEDIVVVAHNSKHEKAAFLSAATKALRERLDKPLEQFQAYFLALLSDKDYSKVLDSISKVDKSLRLAASPMASPSTSPSMRSFQNNRLVCNFCGTPGHTARFCFKKNDRSGRARFSPYQRSFGVGAIPTPSDF
ncbi:hypothetical protein OS493_019978 [Desmophyllum pertusum]|uniref:Uncharacterized protein n=1 Tax=Desmophyllum pertusum TaxID=174260 RepID=A0A9W9YN62_9CNID|nr:hypothetical protein OS493_019978 [Desmophyllum pertusum]